MYVYIYARSHTKCHMHVCICIRAHTQNMPYIRSHTHSMSEYIYIYARTYNMPYMYCKIPSSSARFLGPTSSAKRLRRNWSNLALRCRNFIGGHIMIFHFHWTHQRLYMIIIYPRSSLIG